MAFTLDQVVPWGRNFDEYRRMFALTDEDLQSRILGCADGPASFNAEATRLGMNVTSCDPLYRYDAAAVRARVAATFETVIEETRRNAHEFVWNAIPSVDSLAAVRSAAMETFLADYDDGKRESRYVEAELPSLPFPDGAFSIAVCSHFLFLYTKQLSADFHVAAVRELLRVASDVRIFPLLALGSQPSPHVTVVVDDLRRAGYKVSIDIVPYEFQRGGNQMLRVRAARRCSSSPRGTP
jgi:hypothetical protein